MMQKVWESAYGEESILYVTDHRRKISANIVTQILIIMHAGLWAETLPLFAISGCREVVTL